MSKTKSKPKKSCSKPAVLAVRYRYSNHHSKHRRSLRTQPNGRFHASLLSANSEIKRVSAAERHSEDKKAHGKTAPSNRCRPGARQARQQGWSSTRGPTWVYQMAHVHFEKEGQPWQAPAPFAERGDAREASAGFTKLQSATRRVRLGDGYACNLGRQKMGVRDTCGWPWRTAWGSVGCAGAHPDQRREVNQTLSRNCLAAVLMVIAHFTTCPYPSA